jgi:tetratricopeptide (TPR) repeat protein
MSAVGHYDLSRQASSAAAKDAEIKQAFEELSRALEIDPTNGRAYAKRGEILHSEGRHAEAVEELTRALEILVRKVPPELEPAVLRLRGECFLQLQKYPEAFKDFDDYIGVLERRSARPDGLAYNFRALCYARAGKLEDALKDFNTAAALRSDIPEIWNNRGFCKFKLKDYRGAIEDYQRGLEICRREKIHQAEASSFWKKMGDVYKEIAAAERSAGNEGGAAKAEAEARKYQGEAPNSP